MATEEEKDRWFKRNKEELRNNFIDAYNDEFLDYIEQEYNENREDYS